MRPLGGSYSAAQGNTTRVFFSGKYSGILKGFDMIYRNRIPAISYIASGGYSKPQILPDRMFGILDGLETVFQLLPWLFATRTLVVLSKSR